MEAFFLKLVDMSIPASWLVLVIVAVRLLFRQLPKWISCLLWGLVALRLICPFSIESALSLVPDTQLPPQALFYSMDSETQARGEILDSAGTVVLEKNPVPASQGKGQVLDSSGNVVLEKSMSPTSDTVPTQAPLLVVSRIWMIGLIVMVAYALISYSLLKRRVATAIPIAKGIKRSEFVDTPFVLGLIRSVIYLPASMDAEDVPYVIAHEQAHIRRRDHWWKPLGFLLLSVYWFNPLLWAAYLLLCRDIEAACDEKVIQDLSLEGRRAYSTALLHCSIQRYRITACPLAFGEVGVKERIKGVMHYKKPAFWVVGTALVLGCVIAVCFLTNPETDLRITAKDITPRGLSLECKPKRAFANQEIEDCWLETAGEDGQWQPVEPLSLVPGAKGSIALTASENGKGWDVDWSADFGILLPGEYRMGISLRDKETDQRQELFTSFFVTTNGAYTWFNLDDTASRMPRKDYTGIRVPGKMGTVVLRSHNSSDYDQLTDEKTGEVLLSGNLIRSAAFADLNGDGVCEVYAVVSQIGVSPRLQGYDWVTGQHLQLSNSTYDSLVVRRDRLFVVQKTYPENAFFGIADCFHLSWNGEEQLETLPLESRYQELTRQITGIRISGGKAITLNAEQIPTMVALLHELEGNVTKAPQERLAEANANSFNVIPIYIDYALGYRVLDVTADCTLAWEDGSEEGYLLTNPEPLRDFVSQLTDGVTDRETYGTPFATENEPWQWTSQVSSDAIVSAKAYVCLEYSRTRDGLHSSSMSGTITQQTLSNLLTILGNVPKEAITAGAIVKKDNFRGVFSGFTQTGCSFTLLDGVNNLAVGIRYLNGNVEMLMTSETEQYLDWNSPYLQDTSLWVIEDAGLRTFLQTFCEQPSVINYSVGGKYEWQTPVTHSYEDFSLTLPLIEDWVYEKVAYSEAGHTGIRCRPGGVDTGWLYFSYWPAGFFPEEDSDRLITEGLSSYGPFYTSYPSSVGTPNNYSTSGAIWSYQRTPLEHGDYVILNDGADDWFLAFENQIDATVLLAEIQAQ
ncbi:MAG: M56 family metallopeptidase [Faecousia sp.]